MRRRLILVAHGSVDPRYPAAIEAIAASVRAATPSYDDGNSTRQIVLAFLDHLEPRLADVAQRGDVVVPLLLSTGFHLTVDIPAAAPGCVVTAALGPDDRLAAAALDRLAETGWRVKSAEQTVALVAAGSTDPQAAADVADVAEVMAKRLGCQVMPCFLSAAEPRFGEVAANVDAAVPYLLAPGRFSDVINDSGVPVVAAVIGAHPAIASIVNDRIKT